MIQYTLVYKVFPFFKSYIVRSSLSLFSFFFGLSKHINVFIWLFLGAAKWICLVHFFVIQNSALFFIKSPLYKCLVPFMKVQQSTSTNRRTSNFAGGAKQRAKHAKFPSFFFLG